MIPIDRDELYKRLDSDKKDIQDQLILIKSDLELLLKEKIKKPINK